MEGNLTILLILGAPLVAVIGGIVAGIIRMMGQQRLLELAQRERIAAIEKGLPVPPLPVEVFSGRDAAIRKVHGLLIGGLVTLALGIGLSLTLLLMPIHDGGDAWSIGFVPAFIGIALLIAARLVRKGVDA